VASTHFISDLYPAFIGMLLPLLIQKHGLSMTMAGGLATLNRWPSAAQPFLGYVADRYDARLLIIIPPVITAFAISLLGAAPSYLVVAMLLLIAGCSSATYHPTAGAMVTRVGGNRWGRAASFFMGFGEIGRAVGPLFIASVVGFAGLDHTWLAAIPAVLMAAVAYKQLAGRAARVKRPPAPGGLREALRSRGSAFLLLCAAITFRSLVIASFQVFFPTFLTSTGSTLMYAGFALTVYEIGGVLGAFLGGALSDRFGRRTMMVISQFCAAPLLFASLLLAREPVGLGLLFIGGLLVLSAGGVQLALAQEMLPNNRSMASGITMFLSFEGQVVAAIAMGMLADAVGLQSALTWSILASMLSVPFTLMLPDIQPALTGR
jgi:MFS transporter, FSR family, fosmidomycin resistance protein